MRLPVLVLLALFAGCSNPPGTPPDLGRDLLLVFPEGCMNGGLDGKETDVDCGGDTCKKCNAGQTCLHGRDCTSMFCDNHACVSLSCVDNRLDGDETDVDCGGTCPACADGMGCLMDSDCQDLRCVNNRCAFKCNPPMTNCDGSPQSGCNIDLDTDAMNCGACGMVCPVMFPICDRGSCKGNIEVIAGFKNTYNGTITLTPNKLELFHVSILRASGLLRLGIEGKAAGPNFILALYRDNNGRPDELVASTVPRPLVTGSQEVSLKSYLAPGEYWIASLVDAEALIGGSNQASFAMWQADAKIASPPPTSIYSNGQSTNLFARNIWAVLLQ